MLSRSRTRVICSGRKKAAMFFVFSPRKDDFLKMQLKVFPTYTAAYPIMSQWLNRTGRPILFSCSWPAYQEASGKKVHTLSVLCRHQFWRQQKRLVQVLCISNFGLMLRRHWCDFISYLDQMSRELLADCGM